MWSVYCQQHRVKSSSNCVLHTTLRTVFIYSVGESKTHRPITLKLGDIQRHCVVDISVILTIWKCRLYGQMDTCYAKRQEPKHSMQISIFGQFSLSPTRLKCMVFFSSHMQHFSMCPCVLNHLFFLMVDVWYVPHSKQILWLIFIFIETNFDTDFMWSKIYKPPDKVLNNQNSTFYGLVEQCSEWKKKIFFPFKSIIIVFERNNNKKIRRN